ncbi:PREDICTED: diamine acetyltransferase 2-like [Priapulus caudatus]|uniref:Diamine acetyltransferase 2-like n=1 Tax=Priapulus caudatus TaxID=37621 RepID=A0ABM1DY48_PRICU|nr:PREDICTED: diamine acetyltransferase 2-like [Priapulus caudatus]
MQRISQSIYVLKNDGFGDEKFFNCIVAESLDNEEQSTLVGYCLYFYGYSTFEGKHLYMEDIYVHPGHRGKGCGSRMLQQLAQVAVTTNCCKIQFVVLNWNDQALKFYEKIGAVDLTAAEGWHLCRISRANSEKLAARIPLHRGC